MKLTRVLTVSLLLFSICSVAVPMDISGGKSVVVIGIGQNASGGSAPEFGFNQIPSVVNIDPSRYSSPGKTNFTQPRTPENQTDLRASKTISPFTFVSISTVNGTGDFSDWRSLGGFAGVKAKQISNGRKGSLNSDNRLLLSNEDTNTPLSNKSIAIVSRDVVEFSGLSYRDNENYNNDMDRIRNSFEVVKISKESTYFGKLSYFHSPKDDIESDIWSLYNKSTTYNIVAKYVGASSFNSKMGSGNDSDISEEYRGTFTLARSISNNEIKNQTRLNESYIPCHWSSVKS